MARVDGQRIAWTVLRHAAPLLLLLVSPETVVPYLVMALFDLGVGYAGQQLRHPAAASAHAHDCAETAVERLFANAQLPMLLLLSEEHHKPIAVKAAARKTSPMYEPMMAPVSVLPFMLSNFMVNQ